jgi:micrococcal nuclease
MQIFITTIYTIFILFCAPVNYAFAELNPLLERSAKYGDIKIVRVLSVDTVLLENDEKVTLIGIKGLRPPKVQDVKRDEHGLIIHDEDPTTPLEVEAYRFAKDLLEGKSVRLEFDTERRDDDNILTAYVFLPDGKMLNEEFLRQGYADLKLRMPNMKYDERLRNAYQEARKEMRGLQGNW